MGTKGDAAACAAMPLHTPPGAMHSCSAELLQHNTLRLVGLQLGTICLNDDDPALAAWVAAPPAPETQLGHCPLAPEMRGGTGAWV